MAYLIFFAALWRERHLLAFTVAEHTKQRVVLLGPARLIYMPRKTSHACATPSSLRSSQRSPGKRMARWWRKRCFETDFLYQEVMRIACKERRSSIYDSWI